MGFDITLMYGRGLKTLFDDHIGLLKPCSDIALGQWHIKRHIGGYRVFHRSSHRHGDLIVVQQGGGISLSCIQIHDYW